MGKQNQQQEILVVDGMKERLEMLCGFLNGEFGGREGARIYGFDNDREFIDYAHGRMTDTGHDFRGSVLLVDLAMLADEGYDVLSFLRQMGVKPKSVVLTGKVSGEDTWDVDALMQAARECYGGDVRYLPKLGNRGELVACISDALYDLGEE